MKFNGALFEKIEKINVKELESGFYKNGNKVAEINPRFNFFDVNEKDWL